MSDLITPSNITFTLGIMGVVFGVYHYFKNPQVDLDKRQAVVEKEVDGKANLLAEQIKWEREATEKRFTEMQLSIKDANQTAQNHIHTIDTKVDTLVSTVGAMNLHLTSKLVELSTKLDERHGKVV